jgi:acyl-CoA reductase-like NAD-dependent aldehyde dehydrogenase
MEEAGKNELKTQSATHINIKNKLSNKEIRVPTRLFINNEFTISSDNLEMEVINPASEEIICKVSCGSEKDADKAINAAFTAYFGPWAKLTGDDRAKLLFKLADLFEKNIADFAYLESLDNGKILRDSIDDMEEALKYIRYYGGWADKIEGKSFPCTGNMTISTRRIPYRVVGLISPCNYPLLMSAWKIFPALAAGNTIVLKPSDETPLTSLKLAELFVEAGFPAGVVNIVPGNGNTVGARITSHEKVRKVSFTGLIVQVEM